LFLTSIILEKSWPNRLLIAKIQSKKNCFFILWPPIQIIHGDFYFVNMFSFRLEKIAKIAHNVPVVYGVLPQ
jgi:hypothetical protein